MKRLFTLLAAMIVAMLALAGCGGGSDPAPAASNDTATLKVGATPVPHAEILEFIRDDLAKEGVKLEIIEFSDYVQPNLATNDKELDANFFQHQPYLSDFVTEHPEVKLIKAAGIHIEPMGVYSKKVKVLEQLPDGASIAVPNDPTNCGRSLLLLEKAGLIKLKPNAGITATVQDIVENPKNIKFQELEAAQVPRTLDDVDAAVINSNFAMQVQLNPVKDTMYKEGPDSPYVNIVAIRAGDESRPEIQALIKVLKTDKVKQFIEEKYSGAVVAAF